MPKKHPLIRLLWWLGIAYALSLSLHPYLIGCGCTNHGAHTCGIVQYYALIGACLFLVLVPLGLWLYRNAEKTTFFLLLVLMVQLLCTMVLNYVPLLLGDEVLDFAVRMCLSLPLVPYIGLTIPLGTDKMLRLLFFYLLATIAYGIILYRRERRGYRKAYEKP